MGGGSMLNQNAQMLRDAETKFLGHKNNSGSDKNYLHFTVRPFVPREACPMLKVDRDGEMFITTAHRNWKCTVGAICWLVCKNMAHCSVCCTTHRRQAHTGRRQAN